MEYLNIWNISGIYGGLLFLCIVVFELLSKLKKVPSKITRKGIHLSVGTLTIISLYFVNSKYPFIICSTTFIFLNFLILYFKLSSGLKTTRKTFGIVYFPISFLLLILFAWDNHRYLVVYGLSLLTYADCIAAIFGEKYGNKNKFVILKDTKSIAGSIALFISTCIITFVLLHFLKDDVNYISELTPFTFYSIIMIMGIVAFFCETISVFGSDNISLPLLGSLYLYIFLIGGESYVSSFIISFFIIISIGILALVKKWLTISGVISMTFLGTMIATFSGLKMLIPLFIFFVLSSIISKFKKEKSLSNNSRIDSQRDAFQVFANGAFPTIFACFYYFYPNNFYFVAFCTTLAAATSDTWSSEIGYHSKKLPISIISFKPMKKGLSGGITFLGTLGGLVGTLLLSLCVKFTFSDNIKWSDFLIITFFGFFGTIIDSVLGHFVQLKYQCQICKTITEKPVHCGKITQFFSGKKWIDNNMVNFLSPGISAILYLIFITIF